MSNTSKRRAEPQAIAAFIRTYARSPKAPEPGGPCTGGTTTKHTITRPKETLMNYYKPKPADDSSSHHRRHRRLVRIGQVLMAAGALVAISHWIAHLAPTGQGPSTAEDIFIGYPAGGLLILIGAIVAGRTETKKG
jgi:hypothetical protein